MDFTREPIIESVITPKEGCKLVIRSSKGAGQEEFFVDAVEVVSFGNTFFLRSLERPKAFLVPASDYEILEVRETRMVLKNVGMDRSIKIGGGKETSKKGQKDTPKESPKAEQEKSSQEKSSSEPKNEPPKKQREKRRHYRRRKGRDKISDDSQDDSKVDLPEPRNVEDDSPHDLGEPISPNSQILGSLLPPPPNLISETIERYKGNELFKDVFYSNSDDDDDDDETEVEDYTDISDQEDESEETEQPKLEEPSPEESSAEDEENAESNHETNSVN